MSKDETVTVMTNVGPVEFGPISKEQRALEKANFENHMQAIFTARNILEERTGRIPNIDDVRKLAQSMLTRKTEKTENGNFKTTITFNPPKQEKQNG